MNPVTHLLLSWTVANSTEFDRRERAAITLAGVAPDFDGLGIVAEVATRHTQTPLLWYSDYHRLLGHNLLFAVVASALTWAVVKRRWKTAGFVLFTVHLHFICDVVGGKGPDGHLWPLYYWYPFSREGGWAWSGQWLLNSWQNMVITAGALGWTFYLAWKRGFSPLEIISSRADQAFVETLRQRFPRENSNL